MADILIVEDEPDIAGVIERYLQAEDYTTHHLDEGRGVVWYRGYASICLPWSCST